jgi:hypothetical protein
MLLWVLACTPEADVSALPPISSAPVVPDAPTAPVTGESKALELDFAGGLNGAPYGMAFFIPPNTQATAASKVLSDGSEGFELVAIAPGDAVACTQPVKVIGPFTVGARQRVASVEGVSQSWTGAQAEIRARRDDNSLVEVPGTRYLPIRHTQAATDWESWEQRVEPPPGATKVEVCWRFVGTTGTLEVDRVQLVSEGVPLPPPVPVVSLDWDLDEVGPAGSPEGFDFLIPPGTQGVALTARDGGIRFEVTKAGNAVTCSQPFSVAPGMLFRGRMRLRELGTDARTWTGFVAEVRSFDMIGGLASPAGMPFTTLQTWKATTGDWVEFENAYAPPRGAVTGKLCFRFVESTGEADLDWVAVGPG